MAPIYIRTPLALSLIACAIATAAHSAEIYRCTDAKGVVVFSETSCGRDARKLDLRSPISPGSATVPGVDVRPARRASAQPGEGEDADTTPDAGPDAAKDWAAFKCSTERGMVFYRFSHCPKTLEVTRQRGEGEVQTVILDSWPVHERGTNVPTACQAIHGRSAGKRWGREYDDSSQVADPRKGRRDRCAEAAR